MAEGFGNINPGSFASGMAVHYAPVVRRGVSVLCGSKDLSTPATDEPRYTKCPACLALMTDEQRAERAEQVRRYPGVGT